MLMAIAAGVWICGQYLPAELSKPQQFKAKIHISEDRLDFGEVWESEEQARAWDDKLEPALEAAGIVRPTPEIWQVHNLIQS